MNLDRLPKLSFLGHFDLREKECSRGTLRQLVRSESFFHMQSRQIYRRRWLGEPAFAGAETGISRLVRIANRILWVEWLLGGSG